jgi:hypothetical protein
MTDTLLQVMRKRILQGLDEVFRKYVPFVAALWAAFVVLDLVLAFVVFPSTRGSIWNALAGTTVACIIGMVSIRTLKAFFHKRVMRALESQKGSSA